MREYQHTKTRQNTAVISGTLTTNQPQITQFVPAQANAASVIQQSRPLADSTNVQRGQDEESNGYGNEKGKNRKRKYNNDPADNRPQQVSIIKHSGLQLGNLGSTWATCGDMEYTARLSWPPAQQTTLRQEKPALVLLLIASLRSAGRVTRCLTHP